MPIHINHNRSRHAGASVIAACLMAGPGSAQTAREIRGAAAIEPLQNEPPAKIVIDPADTSKHRTVVYRRTYLTMLDWNAGVNLPQFFQGTYNLTMDGQQVTQLIATSFGQPRFSKDTIAEFEVITNRFDARQGRSTGIQVNAITKSGTNTPAGSFAGYFRDDAFNAADFIQKDKSGQPIVLPGAGAAGINPCSLPGYDAEPLPAASLPKP